MAKEKIVDPAINANGEITEVSLIETEKTLSEPKTIQTFAEVKGPKIEEIMPVTSFDVKKTFPSDYKFAVGDDVEVHGLEECRREHIIGKVSKLLDNYSYALDGHAYPLNKHSIGRLTKIVRTFKESNLRKITIRQQ